MSMTVTEIREHAGQLQGRLDIERRKVREGKYSGHPHANLGLIEALEGRVAELMAQCDALEAQTAGRALREEMLSLPTAAVVEAAFFRAAVPA